MARTLLTVELLEERTLPSGIAAPTGAVPAALVASRDWISYEPTAPFNPNTSTAATPTQIQTDLQEMFNEGWRGLAIYTLDPQQGMDQVPRIAKQIGFTEVIAGLYWFDTAQLSREQQAAVAQVSYIDAYVVGNEGLSPQGPQNQPRYTLPQLQAEMTTIRTMTNRPVTTSEIPSIYTANPTLLTTDGDWVFPNIHPYDNGIRTIPAAIQFTVNTFNSLQSQAGSRSVVIHETWWPTAGNAAANERNQFLYFQSMASTGLPFLWGEAFDQFWKNEQIQGETQGPNWGWHTSTGSPKAIVAALQNVYTATYAAAVPAVSTQLVADFPGSGVWRYNADATAGTVGWQQLLQVDARSVAITNAPGARGNVAASFDGYGTYEYTDAAGWTLLSGSAAAHLDIAGPFIVGDFSGAGVWRFGATGWQQLAATDAGQVGIDAGGNVVAVFTGQGVWRFKNSSGWQQLTKADAQTVTIAGQGYVAASFVGAGTYRYEDATSWQLLLGVPAVGLAIDGFGDVAASFAGYGTYRYEDGTGWQLLTQATANRVAISIGDSVAAEFIGSGFWLYDSPSNGWAKLFTADAGIVGANK